jgi:2-keto-4-pentenoate hydratase/2-oxohepta-3-ene-1,7-dioic acid hydratase in catechol pathway
MDRRHFLQTAGIAGAATMTGAMGLGGTTRAAAQTASGTSGSLPRNMTFATLRRRDGLGLGIKTDRGVLDVVAAERDFQSGAPTTIYAVFKGQGNVAALAQLVEKASSSSTPDRYFIAVDKAQFGPCVTNPEKIICIGLNYRKHAAETGQPVPTTPILFNKFNNSLNHHGGTIAVSEEPAEKFDYEAELVIVMGRTARNVGEADALNYVFGYCTGNDFSARDLQSRTSQWMLGKTLDGFAPIGPWLVSADQVNPDNLKIGCKVNGEARQDWTTSDMVFNCSQLVAYASKHMTLKPGDIIFTGTPHGVILGLPKDKQVWLKAGDQIVTSIENLGDLEFKLT